MSGALRRTFVMTGTVALFGTETEIDMAIDADVVLGKPQTRKYYGAPAKIEIESIYIDGLAKDGNASMGYLWMRTVPPHMVDYGVIWLMSDEAVSDVLEELYDRVGTGGLHRVSIPRKDDQ